MKFFIAFLISVLIFQGCSTFQEKDKIDKLNQKIDSVISLNDSLKKKILVLEANKQVNLEDLGDNKILGNKIEVVKVKTGYDPYYDNDLFLPTVSIMFKNISGEDIATSINVKAIFIDKSTDEQLGEDFFYLSTISKIFTASTKKQVNIHSPVGWHALSNQDVSVRIYINNDFFKELKVENTTYSGRI